MVSKNEFHCINCELMLNSYSVKVL